MRHRERDGVLETTQNKKDRACRRQRNRDVDKQRQHTKQATMQEKTERQSHKSTKEQTIAKSPIVHGTYTNALRKAFEFVGSSIAQYALAGTTMSYAQTRNPTAYSLSPGT